MTHLLRARLRERRIAPADSLIARLDSLEALPRTAEFHALRAFSHGTETDRDRALAELRASGNELVRATAHRVAIYAGNLMARRACCRRFCTKPGRRRAGSRTRLARTTGGRARPLARQDWRWPPRSNWTPRHRGRSATGRAAVRAGCACAGRGRRSCPSSGPRRAPATTYSWRAVYNGLHPTLRDYLLGLLELRRGDGVRRRAAALAARGAQGGGRDGRELARGLAESLLGHVAIANARGSEALAHFDTARLRVSEGLLESVVGSQAYERWARAELLFRMGRLQEALPWYATLGETSIDGLVYPPRPRQDRPISASASAIATPRSRITGDSSSCGTMPIRNSVRGSRKLARDCRRWECRGASCWISARDRPPSLIDSAIHNTVRTSCRVAGRDA